MRLFAVPPESGGSGIIAAEKSGSSLYLCKIVGIL